jgi:integrase/recombinase XerD
MGPLYENDTNLIAAYRRMRMQEGKSKDNADCLCRPVTHFSKFLATRAKSLFTATSPDCEDWLKSLTAEGMVDRSKASKLSLLHVFYEWLNKANEADIDPTEFSHVRKTWADKPRSAPQKELNEILDELRAGANVAGASLLEIRDWAILELFYGCAARVTEMCRLKVDDLSVEQGNVLIHGKKLKDRFPPITDAARDAVDFYLRNARPKLERRKKGQRDKALFLSKLGKQLGRGGMGNIVKKADAKLSSHKIRHSHAQHRADAGDRIEDIQKDLGHAKLRTTMVYTPNVSFDQLQSEHRRCHPRSRNCAKLLDPRNPNPLPPGEGRRIDRPSPEVHL